VNSICEEKYKYGRLVGEIGGNMPPNEHWKNYILGSTMLDNEKLIISVVRTPSGEYFLRIKRGENRKNTRLDLYNLLRLFKDLKSDFMGD